VERLDIVRMVKLYVPPEFSAITSSDRVRAIADVVLPPFFSQHVLPDIERAVSELPLFRGLDRDQVRRLASVCRTKEFAQGEAIIEEGGLDRTLYILLDGEATISRAATSQDVGVVRPGECLGEMSLLTAQPHSASARATRPTRTATLTHGELTSLVRFRPDVGLVVFRNLAIGLGAKLGRASVSLAASNTD
jgi:CRP-like cAMP-binding protein